MLLAFLRNLRFNTRDLFVKRFFYLNWVKLAEVLEESSAFRKFLLHSFPLLLVVPSEHLLEEIQILFDL